MNRAPTWVRPAANGRANHPWSAAVEQGCSTLPETGGRDAVSPLPEFALRRTDTDGRLGEPSLPKANAEGSTRCCPYLDTAEGVGRVSVCL